MALSAFDDPGAAPTAAEVSRRLGGAASLFARLLEHLQKSHGPLVEVWRFAGPKFGWSLRVKRKERVVLYLTPQEGRFLVGVVLGEKAVAAARASALPAPVLALLEAAPRYAEGRGIRLAVGPGDDLSVVEALAALKLAR